MSKFHDDSARASDPVKISLSMRRFRKLKVPRNAHMQRTEVINEHLSFGDSRAAVVVSTSPLLVAAYTDELDCVVLLRFASTLTDEYELSVGSRLLTVNTYTHRGNEGVVEDLRPGPRAYPNYSNYYPLISEFLSDDVTVIEARKAEISEQEWGRTLDLGKAALGAVPRRVREGHPYTSDEPAYAAPSQASGYGAPPPAPQRYQSGSSGFAVHRRERREATPLEGLLGYAVMVLVGVAVGALAGAFLPFLARSRVRRSGASQVVMNEAKSDAIFRAVIGGVVGALGGLGVAAASAKPGEGSR